MTVSLFDYEWEIRDEIAGELGIDANGVMRQGMLDLGRKLGITRESIIEKKHDEKKKTPKH